MKELFNHYDIFTLPNSNPDENIVCVTTNGIIKKDGRAVMGAGIAKTADTRFDLGGILANHLRTYGNTVGNLGSFTWKHSKFHICSFPTKEHWRDASIPELIYKSATQLVELANTGNFQHVFLTPPGCGCGGLNYETDVKPILEPIFDDRFTIVFRGKTY